MVDGEPGEPGRKDTIMLVLFVSKIVVQDKILDTSLFFPFGGLLGLHGDCEAGVGRKLDRASLDSRLVILSMPESIIAGILFEVWHT